MRKYLGIVILMAAVLAAIKLIVPHFVIGADAKPSSRMKWEKTVLEANKEGQITVYGGEEITHPEILAVFNKEFPDIKVVTVSGHSEVIERIVAERRAERYLVDVFAYGPNAARAAYLAKFLDPIPPALILPEVTDTSKWYGEKHHYGDPENRYIFIYEGTPSNSSVAYNTNLVDPNEFKSTWDVLNPKWAGNIGFFAYGGAAIPTPVLMLYYNPDVGPEFLKRLFNEMKVTVSRDRRQATDWLARGKYALCFMCRDIEKAQKQGLPVATFGAHDLKEGGELGGGNSSVIVLISRPPHPNAAKVFLNWYLSRHGQMVWQKVMNTKVFEPSNSMRIDISKDDVLPDARRLEGWKYRVLGFLDPRPVQNFYKELLEKAKPLKE